MLILNNVKPILDSIVSAGGTPYLVGGCVRDHILGLSCKDIDIEVFDISLDVLTNVLSQFGDVDCVGKSFGVVKLRYNDIDLDFSLPRLDHKTGDGHKGFDVEHRQDLSIEEAAARRDFTINSMSMDINGNIIDVYGGKEDLDCGVLRATSSAFVEDELRVLRGFQFCSRFNLKSSLITTELCRELLPKYSSLPKERVFGEWYKWAEKCQNPSLGIIFLRDCGWINLYPQISYLEDTLQDPEWHPETLFSDNHDVLSHTCYSLNAMADICKRENITGENKVILMFAALCHDFGKVSTTKFEDGRIRARGHDVAGVEPARIFLESIGCFPRIIEKVLPLVREHMVHCYSSNGQVNLKKLSNRLYPATINELLYVIEADHSGRPPLEKGLPEQCHSWKEQANALQVLNDKPKPIIMGRHLIEMGLKPGREFKDILNDCYVQQLDGLFCDLEGGLKCLKKYHQLK